ncbi:MAG: hypothetical protein H6704_29245 [Myxococcales bacterium]|nr:hypothetical protein [Myxococcales bacterium]
MAGSRTETITLPDDLRTFLAEVWASIQADDDEATRIESDDLLQAECGYGGLIDAEAGRYLFTYLPDTPEGGRWTFELLTDDVRKAATGELDEVTVEKHPDAVPGGGGGGGAPAGGLADLLASLLGPGGGRGARPALDLGDEDDDEDAEGEPEDSEGAEALLALLEEHHHIELGPEADRAALVKGIGDILATEDRPRSKAQALADWLIEQPGVEELYIGDEDLSRILAAW